MSVKNVTVVTMVTIISRVYCLNKWNLYVSNKNPKVITKCIMVFRQIDNKKILNPITANKG